MEVGGGGKEEPKFSLICKRPEAPFGRLLGRFDGCQEQLVAVGLPWHWAQLASWGG